LAARVGRTVLGEPNEHIVDLGAAHRGRFALPQYGIDHMEMRSQIPCTLLEA